jgi:hypothetical protein
MSVGVASILTECIRANVRRFRVSRRIFTAAIIDKAVAERMTQKIDMGRVIVPSFAQSYW